MKGDDSAIAIYLDDVAVLRMVVWMHHQRGNGSLFSMKGSESIEIQIKDDIAIKDEKLLVQQRLGGFQRTGSAKRAVFVIDGHGVIRYREVLQDARNEPDYQKVYAAIESL